MSILTKGMEMPDKKNGAVLIIYPDGKCAFEDSKTYQAVSVPPHGDLIDRQALLKLIEDPDDDGRFGYLDALDITCAPTIIPAEEGE